MDRGPARAHHRRHAGHAAGQHRRAEQHRVRRRHHGAGQQQQQAGRAGRGGPRQHPCLAVPVDPARHLRRQQRVGQHEGGRHRTGQRIAAAQLRQQGDDADAGHRQRQAGQQPGQGKPGRAGRSEQVAIRGGHQDLQSGGLPGARGATTIHTGRMNKRLHSYAPYVNNHALRM
ncbi:hypothetical protein G6F31_014829 [Rhizopus arrhizus]|nr:hypothetical protein G6F31_014829 [Rhizopus arrhizus]